MSKYDLWLAQWNVSKPAVSCGIWQTSEVGKIDGINGNVDLDISYKDYPAIMKYNGLNGFSKSQPALQYITYTVQKGDTLWGIAKTKLGDGNRWAEISKLNNLTSTNIFPNQTLKIPK